MVLVTWGEADLRSLLSYLLPDLTVSWPSVWVDCARFQSCRRNGTEADQRALAAVLTLVLAALPIGI